VPTNETADRNAFALEVDHLSVTLEGTPIFRDVSFGVRQGETLAIIGPNGAGKTVLLRALIGALPHTGTVRWASGTRLGYVPQKLDIDRDLPITGHDLLRARLRIAQAARADVDEAIRRVDLSATILGEAIGNLSGGQFQRLLVAFALIGKPDVLLLDEPGAGVDAPGQEALNAVLRRLQHEHHVTILLISHDLSVVYQNASTVLCLSRHQAWAGPPTRALTPHRLEELYGSPISFHSHHGPGH
jgi:zinc transport system ATP-binding protein